VSDSFTVVQEHLDLLAYVDALQKKNAEALAFYPRVVFEREAARGRLFLGLLHGEPCGYLYVGAGNAGPRRAPEAPVVPGGHAHRAHPVEGLPVSQYLCWNCSLMRRTPHDATCE
jgi:hypothetical protein